jgi:hypothetical protein
MLKKRTKKRIAKLCLVLCSFFLPFGYDALFKVIMDVTSYWTADIIFYIISAMFFIAYIHFEEINLVKTKIKILKKIKLLCKKYLNIPMFFHKKNTSNSKRRIQ